MYILAIILAGIALAELMDLATTKLPEIREKYIYWNGELKVKHFIS